jgi:putative spermidine/putrescine transport system permease protein
LQGISEEFEEASVTLGASKAQTFLYVILPMIKPSLIAAFAFGFLWSFSSVTLSVFLTGLGETTLPQVLFSRIMYGFTPELSAISTVVIIFLAIIIYALEKMLRISKYM